MFCSCFSDTSENEDTTTARKMADGAEIVKMEDEDSVTLDKCIANSEKYVLKYPEIKLYFLYYYLLVLINILLLQGCGSRHACSNQN